MLIVGPASLTLGLAALVFWPSLPLALSAVALVAVGSGFGLSYSFFTEHVIQLARPGERDVTAGAVPTLENICAAMALRCSGYSAMPPASAAAAPPTSRPWCRRSSSASAPRCR